MNLIISFLSVTPSTSIGGGEGHNAHATTTNIFNGTTTETSSSDNYGGAQKTVPLAPQNTAADHVRGNNNNLRQQTQKSRQALPPLTIPAVHPPALPPEEKKTTMKLSSLTTTATTAGRTTAGGGGPPVGHKYSAAEQRQPDPLGQTQPKRNSVPTSSSIDNRYAPLCGVFCYMYVQKLKIQ
jgi:hypothetical protein